MAGRFGLDRDEVASLLANHPAPILSKRGLFTRWRSGFQWTPGDHLCVAGELEVVRSRESSAGGYRLSGELYAAHPIRVR
jgi:hypothetical protein